MYFLVLRLKPQACWSSRRVEARRCLGGDDETGTRNQIDALYQTKTMYTAPNEYFGHSSVLQSNLSLISIHPFTYFFHFRPMC
jgi:hypothetical protein